MYTISYEQIQNLIETIENQTPDLSPEYRVGDFVELNRHYTSAWSRGHILRITDSGLILAHGDKNTPKSYRLMGMGVPVSFSHVTGHWRQIDRVTKEVIDGLFPVTTVDTEWVKIK